jgi:hypothetical protein
MYQQRLIPVQIHTTRTLQKTLQKNCHSIGKTIRPHEVFPNAAQGVSKRRTRKWPTPHAKFAIAARGIDRRRQPKITQKPPKTAHFAKQRCQSRTIQPQIHSFNNLIITGNSI